MCPIPIDRKLNMEWQHPEWLYLILPLGAAWLVLSLYSRRRRRRAAEAFVAQAMWSRILPADSRSRFWMKTLLREVGPHRRAGGAGRAPFRNAV